MIKAENIFKNYGEVEVLKGINLQISKGEIVSIVGTSGAGKTTLLQVLGTLLPPDKGSITIGDTNIRNLSDKKLAHFRNQKVGFIFQFHQLLPEFTAIENVCIPAFIAKAKKKETMEKAEHLLSILNLSHRIHFKPNELSGGEKQRVAIARSLINNPDVILADEPSGNLDSANTKELYEIIVSLREKFGQTFIIVTHNQSLAEMSDRMLTIHDGRITNH